MKTKQFEEIILRPNRFNKSLWNAFLYAKDPEGHSWELIYTDARIDYATTKILDVFENGTMLQWEEFGAKY